MSIPSPGTLKLHERAHTCHFVGASNKHLLQCSCQVHLHRVGQSGGMGWLIAHVLPKFNKGWMLMLG